MISVTRTPFLSVNELLPASTLYPLSTPLHLSPSMPCPLLAPSQPVVDAAVSKCPCVERVFVARRTGNVVLTPERDVDLEEALSLYAPVCEAEPTGANDLLFLLYTSGSTGKSGWPWLLLSWLLLLPPPL